MSTPTESDWSQYEPLRGRQVATALPCPTWCTLGHGHPFETETVDANPLRLADREGESGPPLYRVHRHRFGSRPTHVAVETYERTNSPTGPTDLGIDPQATLIRLQFPDAHGYLSPDGARRLASLLCQAADLAEMGAER